MVKSAKVNTAIGVKNALAACTCKPIWLFIDCSRQNRFCLHPLRCFEALKNRNQHSQMSFINAGR
jgi:hypothetical protein